MANYQDTVAGEVRAEMARQGRSQQQVAAAAGWTQQYLSRRLTGANLFDTRDIEVLAGVLGVPLSQFVTPPARSAAS
jgi:transcriptional regulator with XRE-family HTH domain